MNTLPPKLRCTYHISRTQKLCRAWAIRDTDPPRCSFHRHTPSPPDQNLNSKIQNTQSLKSKIKNSQSPTPPYDLEDIANLLLQVSDRPLDAEITTVRTTVRETMLRLREQLEPAEFARIARLVFSGANTIANLLRAQRALSGQSADGLAGAIAQALDELSTEWGLDP
jgi:hypothetical protein